jgi:tRNA threonylcarbamoyladenosine biosynthesis protein TsaB
MIVLACETSTLLGSVAVVKDQAVLASVDSFRQGSHSDVLNMHIEAVLKEARINLNDIDLFASGLGPGSFTGIRISLNTIKTFAFCFDKPCVGVDSLRTLAEQLRPQALQDKPLVAMINAYKNMVYIATYRKRSDGSLIIVKDPSVVRVQNLNSYLESQSYVVGDGYSAYQAYIDTHVAEKVIRPPVPQDEPHAKTLGLLALQKAKSQTTAWNELMPIYLRESEAEENIKGIKYQPLF